MVDKIACQSKADHQRVYLVTHL